MKRHILLLSLALTSLLLSSCKEEPSQLPAISGKAGEIIVIATKTQWESDLGTTVRSVLADEFPQLPQKEPKFNLSNIPESGFNRMVRVHRNMLYLQIQDSCQTGMKIRKDVWAAPQTMLIVTAPDEQSASQFIMENGETICSVFEKAERDRSIQSAMQFEDKSLRNMVSVSYGGSPYFPEGYSLKKQTEDFCWISYETSYTNQGIFIYRFPYEGTYQLTPAYLVNKRNEVMQENVPATTEGSYMITNPAVIPTYNRLSYNGIEFAELRGLWDTHNDFMGGPFVEHAMLSPDGQYIVVVEGFVYAPKFNKRNYLRSVEAILFSFKWRE